MMRALLSLFGPKYPNVLVYMLQITEYRAGAYLKWYWRTQDFGTVMYRRTLAHTKAARLLVLALRLGMFVQIVVGFTLLGLWHWHNLAGGWEFGLALLLSYPIVWAH